MERRITSQGLVAVLSLCRSSTWHLARQKCSPLQRGLTPLCGKSRVAGDEMFEDFWVALRSWLQSKSERQRILMSFVWIVPGAGAESGLGGRGGARSFPAPHQPEGNHQITQHTLHHRHFLLTSVGNTSGRTLLFLTSVKVETVQPCLGVWLKRVSGWCLSRF